MIVTGLRSLISRKVEKFQRSQLTEFNELDQLVKRQVYALVNDELRPVKSGVFQYRSLLKDLAMGWDPEQVLTMIETFPVQLRPYASALVVKMKALIDTLLTKYPQTNYVTATGSINLVPADKKIFKFVQILEVLCDPLSVLNLMSDGSLLHNQADAVRMVYPSLSQAIDANLLERTVAKKAQDKSWELPERTEIGLRAWFGKGPVSPETLQKAQANVARNNDRKDQAAQTAPATSVSQSKQTGAQRAEAV